MNEQLLGSREIVEKAIADYKPYATVLALSGGDDSLLTFYVLQQLGIKPDFILHGNTRTGLPETTDFVRSFADKSGIAYIEADAGTSYEDYVLRKGFFGKGVQAHRFSYHVLKATHFRKAVSKHIRHGKRNRPVLFLNGARIDESENRANNFGDNPYRVDGNNIWVNVVHWWLTKERDEYLYGNSCERNPVAKCLGRSGECMCGTMQNMIAAQKAAELSPRWAEWWYGIRKEVLKKFDWDWGQNISQTHKEKLNGQLQMDDFMPMCVSCKNDFINRT